MGDNGTVLYADQADERGVHWLEVNTRPTPAPERAHTPSTKQHFPAHEDCQRQTQLTLVSSNLPILFTSNNLAIEPLTRLCALQPAACWANAHDLRS